MMTKRSADEFDLSADAMNGYDDPELAAWADALEDRRRAEEAAWNADYDPNRYAAREWADNLSKMLFG